MCARAVHKYHYLPSQWHMGIHLDGHAVRCSGPTRIIFGSVSMMLSRYIHKSYLSTICLNSLRQAVGNGLFFNIFEWGCARTPRDSHPQSSGEPCPSKFTVGPKVIRARSNAEKALLMMLISCQGLLPRETTRVQ